MKKLLSGMFVVTVLLTIMSMTAFAAYVPSPEDEYLTEATTETGENTSTEDGSTSTTRKPGDDEYLPDGGGSGNNGSKGSSSTYDKSKAPRTGDARAAAYFTAMAAIAAAGVAVIARRKEN